MIRRHVFVGVLLVGAFIPATAAVAAVKNGGSCTKVGQLVTVKQKKKSVDFICTQEGKKKVWRVRPSGAMPGGATGTTPGGTAGTTPGGTTTAKPGEAPGGTATASDCDKRNIRRRALVSTTSSDAITRRPTPN